MKKVIISILILISLSTITAQNRNGNKNQEKRRKEMNYKQIEGTKPESLDGGVLLGNPTEDSITLSIYSDNKTELFIEYGLHPDNLNSRTDSVTVKSQSLVEVTIDNLIPATKYYYRSSLRGVTGSFFTSKPENTTFSFIIEADPHFDDASSIEVYKKALVEMGKLDPDFMMDLGDASMAEKLSKTNEAILERFQLVRSYWDDIGHSVPIFMVLGNHDGEAGWNSSFISKIRDEYFINPKGLTDFIYTFTWGDVRIISINPYEYHDKKPKGDNWEWSLGKEQYDWLEETLKKNKSKHTLLFIHNLVGGISRANRGGKDAAQLYEWGGDEFKTYRHGWKQPIHDMLVEYGIDIVFHGHDHFYAKEELDGIIYQLVPQPSLGRKQNINNLKPESGYSEGVFYPSPGFLYVTSDTKVLNVDLKSSVDGSSIYSYDIE